MTTETYTVIIPAGGIGKRLQEHLGGENKQFVKIGDKTIIEHVINKFFDYIPIKEFIIALGDNNFENKTNFLLDRFPTLKIVKGGEKRQDSVYNALKHSKAKQGKVIIHDAVRPFFKKEELDYVIKKASEYKGAVVAVRAKDTVRLGFEDVSKGAIDRKNVWLVQTPQVFNLKILRDCYEKAYKENFFGTDDAMLFERYYDKIAFSEGGYHNFKITDPYDFKIAKLLINEASE